MAKRLGSKEFAEYSPKQDEYSDFIRSYMEVSLNMYNPDQLNFIMQKKGLMPLF